MEKLSIDSSCARASLVILLFAVTSALEREPSVLFPECAREARSLLRKVAYR